MKKALAILVVIAFVAALSSAATYQPTKDTFYRFDAGTPGGSNTYGGANQQRAGKGNNNQDGFYMDFDRAAIQADASAALGHTATAADFSSGAVTVSLQLMSGSGGTHTAVYYPGYFTSTTPWAESTASWLFADQTNSVAWNTNGSNLTACPKVISATGQVWAAADLSYQTFTIDPSIAAGYVFATTPGVALEMFGLDYANVGPCFSKEGSVTLFGTTSYAGPVLTVSVVPEPCSMLLIAAGAVATLVRRRR